MVKSTHKLNFHDSSHPVIAFLETLDSQTVLYVSWKNNHELAEALDGKTDLDIFVPLQYRGQVLSCAIRLGWIRLENPVARYPWVTHLYILDQDLQEHHLHVYFKVVTGESWLKEFILPFDKMLINERVRAKDYGVWVLNSKTQAYLFAVRHLLKGGTLLSRNLYQRELDSYRNEWFQCHQKTDVLNDWGPVRLDKFIAGSGLQGDEVQLPNVLTSIKFRATLAPYLRLTWWSLPFRRINSLTLRSMNKLIFRKKKILPEGGLVLVISGIDGSGKSTMINEAGRIFSKFITVQRFGLGRPQGSFLEAVRSLVKRSRAPRDFQSKEEGVIAFTSPPSLFSSVSAVILALLRLRMARKAMKSALKGHLALVDRWPTDVTGMMDGPRLHFVRNDALLSRLCVSIEHWAYLRMPRADICFFLEVPESTLIDRNRKRIKAEKESDAEIIARFKQNQGFYPLVRKVVHFENNGPVEQKHKELLLRIWQEMAAS